MAVLSLGNTGMLECVTCFDFLNRHIIVLNMYRLCGVILYNERRTVQNMKIREVNRFPDE